jgi:hypothetical protein
LATRPTSLHLHDATRRHAHSLFSTSAHSITLLRCISNTCYGNVYGSDALEDGEVDVTRGRTFRSCARNELRNVKVAEVERINEEKKSEAARK